MVKMYNQSEIATLSSPTDMVTLNKRNHLPSAPFYDFIIGTEEDEILSKHFNLRRQLIINALKRSKYISPVIEAYHHQENELKKKLPEIALESVLNISLNPDLKNEAPQNFRENLRKIMINYEFVNNEFVSEMNKYLEQRRKVLTDIQNTVLKLRQINKITSALALLSMTMELASGIGKFLHTFFTVDLKSNYYSILTWLIGGASVAGSVFAISYSKHTYQDIILDLQDEKYLLRSLLIVDRRANAVDEDVEDLFPHGIDLEMVKQIAQDTDENFTDDSSWKQNLCFAILLPNFEKNKRLIHDRKFLASVQLFIENPSAKIWLLRFKLRKLLDETTSIVEDHLEKKLFIGNEIMHQAALNLYSIFFPLFVQTRNMQKLRLLFTSMAAIKAVVNLSHNNDEEFSQIRRTSVVLLKDYKSLKRFSQEFMNEYD